MRLKRRYIAISGALGATAILGLGISLPANGSEKVEGSETKGSPSGPEFKNQCEMAGGEMSRPRTGVYECSFTQDAETDWVIVCSQIEDKCHSEERPASYLEDTGNDLSVTDVDDLREAEPVSDGDAATTGRDTGDAERVPETEDVPEAGGRRRDDGWARTTPRSDIRQRGELLID